MTHREQQILRLIEANPMIPQQSIADALGITRSSVAVHISNLTKKGHIAGKGYVLRKDRYAAVVGGINVDIGGRAFGPLVPEDSNPGAISFSLGGVGRNIAHNLALLGADVRLFSAIGEDIYGQNIAASCADLGIDISHVLRLRELPTSTYLYIAGPDGDMAMALSDMEIAKRITPRYLASHLPVLRNARVIVADTNIPEESLQYLAENTEVPLFCDPVSVAKAAKLLPILHKIHTLKPNRLEAGLLSGVTIRERQDAEKAAEILLKKGVERVFLSMGAEGVYAATQEEKFWQPTLAGNVVNTTGCGDAFMAALVWAWLEDLPLRGTALAGAAAGAIAMESDATINPAMGAEALKNRMKENMI